MFGIEYIKFDSMDYVIHYRNGQIKKEGRGLSYFYFAPNASIVRVPVKSSDLPFVFNETTKDYQQVTVQGQITYKIVDPKKITEQLDFTIDRTKSFVTDDYEKLQQRLINEAQTATTSFVHATGIKDVLNKQKTIEENLLTGMRESKVLNLLGVEVLSVSILGVKADPEMSRALEAETRESLQKDADKAIYDRRNFAVEQERKIKESELNTEIAIEEKEKQIVEKKMETDVVKRENDKKLREMEIATEIAIEEQNKELTASKVENQRKLAEVKEFELRAIMNAYKDVDWKVLTALGGKHNDAGNNIALAFRELAENSSKIGNLNITPDLLESLVTKNKGR